MQLDFTPLKHKFCSTDTTIGFILSVFVISISNAREQQYTAAAQQSKEIGYKDLAKKCEFLSRIKKISQSQVNYKASNA